MIRSRLGVVTMGSGGNAADYNYLDGLSSDPRLAYYLQDLTPAQLQNALDNKAPSITDMTGCIELAGGGLNCPQTKLMDCSDPAQYDETMCGARNPLASLLPKLPSVPTAVWIAGGGLLAALLFLPRGGR